MRRTFAIARRSRRRSGDQFKPPNAQINTRIGIGTPNSHNSM
jgi:hypothetical protein